MGSVLSRPRPHPFGPSPTPPAPRLPCDNVPAAATELVSSPLKYWTSHICGQANARCGIFQEASGIISLWDAPSGCDLFCLLTPVAPLPQPPTFFFWIFSSLLRCWREAATWHLVLGSGSEEHGGSTKVGEGHFYLFLYFIFRTDVVWWPTGQEVNHGKKPTLLGFEELTAPPHSINHQWKPSHYISGQSTSLRHF